MEKFHLAADSEEFPNTIFCRMRFTGELNEAIARDATKRMLKRHLLIRKTVRGTGRKLSWHLSAEQSEQSLDQELAKMLTWTRDVDPAKLADESFSPQLPTLSEDTVVPKVDINIEHGLHAWVFVGDGRTTILAGIHHAAGDGGGGIQLLSDFFQVYDNLCSDRNWDFGLRKLDYALLKSRGKIGFFSWNYLKHLWKQPIAAFGFIKFMLNRFRTFEPHAQSLTPTTNFPGIVGLWVDESDAKAMQSFADAQQVRVNSVAMAAVFQACQKWLQASNDGRDVGWIRMLLPISYRSKSDLRLPVTNKATIVQVDRRFQQMQNPKTFLHYLNREIDIVIGWQFDKIFLMVIGLFSWLPKRLTAAAQKPKAKGTIVFTNLGEPFRLKKVKKRNWVGELEWQDFDFVGPILPQLPVNFTLQRHQQRYRLSLHFDRRVLSEETAKKFLTSIQQELPSMRPNS